MTTPSPAPANPRRAWSRWVLAVGLLAAVAAFYFLGLHQYLSFDNVRSHVDEWKAQSSEHLLPALVLFLAVYVAVTALSLPVAAPLSMVGGALFGVWVGVSIVVAAATAGATLAFLGSRYLFRDWVQRRFGERLRALNAGIDRDGAFYLFTLRLAPVVPFWLINLGMGLTPLRAWTFVWISLVGMLPGSTAYVWAGQSLGQIQSPRDVLSWQVLLAFTVLGLLPLALRKVVVARKAPVSP